MARERIRLSDLENKAAREQEKGSAATENRVNDVPSGTLNARQNSVLRMQQTQGNAAVRRMLVQRALAGEDGGKIDDDVTQKINSSRGSGQSLDSNVAQQMGSAMDHDFSSVKVHTDSSSDMLNRQLSAKAFTTGSDIYFQSGAYQPGSSSGQELIGHELTHVKQQSGATPSGDLTLGPPGDSYEQEAEQVSHQVVSSMSEPAAQRHEDDDDEGVMRQMDEVQRHEDDCEDCG